MDSFYKADVFFFITAVAVVIVTVLLAVFIGYGIMVMRNAKHITQILRRQSDLFASDIDSAREYLKTQGVTLKTIFKLKDFFSNKSKKINKK